MLPVYLILILYSEYTLLGALYALSVPDMNTSQWQNIVRKEYFIFPVCRIWILYSGYTLL